MSKGKRAKIYHHAAKDTLGILPFAYVYSHQLLEGESVSGYLRRMGMSGIWSIVSEEEWDESGKKS